MPKFTVTPSEDREAVIFEVEPATQRISTEQLEGMLAVLVSLRTDLLPELPNDNPDPGNILKFLRGTRVFWEQHREEPAVLRMGMYVPGLGWLFNDLEQSDQASLREVMDRCAAASRGAVE